MKATLEFDLPEDQDAFTLANKGAAHFFALGDVRDMLRTHWKYGVYDEATAGVIERIRDEFYEILSANGVNLEEIQ